MERHAEIWTGIRTVGCVFLASTLFRACSVTAGSLNESSVLITRSSRRASFGPRSATWMIRAGSGAASMTRRAFPVPAHRQHADQHLSASLFMIAGAVALGSPWQIVPAAVLASIIASVEASEVPRPGEHSPHSAEWRRSSTTTAPAGSRSRVDHCRWSLRF